MAQQHYTPYSTVNPGGAEPGQLHVDVNPNQFGAQIGAAGERMGQSLEYAGSNLNQIAVQRAEFLNQVGADQAFNNLQTQYHNMMYGDPNTGAQGFYSMRGEDALKAYPHVSANLETMRQNIKASLPTQQMQLQFDQASRRLQMFTEDTMGRHYDQQSQIYAQNVNKATVANNNLSISTDPANEANYQNGLHELTRAYVRSAQVANGMNASDDVINDATNKAEQDAIKNRALSWANKDPSAAYSWLQTQEKKLTPVEYDAIQSHLKGLADKAEVTAGANSVIGSGSAPVGLHQAIRGQEGSGANQTSVNGAVGSMQVTPAFFKQYAKPGENFNNEADRVAVADRGIDELSQKYNGDPARVAVAYFSGENNVAPAGSTTPWIDDKRDGNGTSTSEYVRGVLSRTGQSGDTGGAGSSTHSPGAFVVEQDMMNKAWSEAQRRFPDRPDLQRQLVGLVYEHIQQANTLQAKYEAEQQKALHDQQEAAGQQVMKSLMTPGAQFDPATIRDNPYLTWQQKDHLWKLSQEHYHKESDHDVKTYGSGFWDAYQKVHALPGDPGRITDPSQLWSRGGPSGDLTLSGIEKLTQEIQGKRTPDGEAESTMKKQFLEMAKSQITGSNEGLHIRDPKGDELYLKFLAQVLPAFDKGKSDGKSASSLLDPNSKDYIGSAISSFKRPMNVWVQDMMNDNQEVPGATATPAAAKGPDLTTQDGIVTAYKNGQITREQATKRLIDGGFARAPTPKPPEPKVPTNG